MKMRDILPTPTHVISQCIGSGKTLPSCSVIVCTRNRPEQLKQCLQGIRQLCYPDVDVIVVDNASDNDAAKPIADAWNARYIQEPVIGLSRSRNRGARFSEAEVVAFIDDDAVPNTDWLCNLIEEFSDPRVMAVTGVISAMTPSPAGIEQYSRARQQRREFDSSTDDWFALANFGGIGDGANMAFRRKVFDSWDGFNERLGLGTAVCGSEEHNAYFELIKRGHRVVFTPRSVVQHPFPETSDDARKRSSRYVAAGCAYMARLFVEEPVYRRDLLSFVRKALTRRIRTRRDPLLTRWQELRAFIRGVRLYLHDRHDAQLKETR
jgi:cellulose synthase/poly-beta-1,6-N-acetylglucosamine synthase-like glycosyltransferase